MNKKPTTKSLKELGPASSSSVPDQFLFVTASTSLINTLIVISIVLTFLCSFICVQI